MEWALEFYEKQNEWSGVSEGDVSDTHREKALLIEEFIGRGSKRILELGAGGGHNAAATADLGHTVVAIEQVPRLAAHAQKLAASRPAQKMQVILGDFYTVSLDGRFDAACYWDGFGIGSDDEQRRLLRRIAEWLTPAGSPYRPRLAAWRTAIAG